MRAGWRTALALSAALCLLPACATRGPLIEPGERAVELAQTPFFPQDRYQCGPAALATVLGAAGVHVTPEELVPEGLTFDVVLNMEVIEHVADRAAFLAACCDLLAEDGLMFIATINRTAKAFALAIVGAEYILRWLPIGTHDWRKFLRPSELAAGLRPHDVEFGEITGVGYNPLTDEWSLTRDLDVNYMVVAKKS